VGALTSYSDVLRRGLSPDYSPIWLNWVQGSCLQATFSLALYLVLQRWPIRQAKAVVIGYGLVLLLFMPLEMAYLSCMHVVDHGEVLTWHAMLAQLRKIQAFMWFSELTMASSVYAALVALSIWEQNKQREQSLQQMQLDNLQLHLALEQQRLLALRAQLEPHFVFNALNAISALVRSDDKKVALTGIKRLSDLLRYALLSSSRDWVSVQDELGFIEDYVALQRLRYGERLQVQIVGAQAAVLQVPCPPLLLQPLLENALRHDLDCHEETTDIALRFTLAAEQLQICLSNSMRAVTTAKNPGLGMGLPQTKARLQLAYGASANLIAG
ncbi:MAG: histidine kinase, partial [Burkholderiales bacterium]|nr:histidine kinase [Burkholderiales bacterium]